MAKKVERLPPQRYGGIYRWDEWLNGDIWELTPGEDFKATPETVRSAAYAAARNMKPRVKVTVREYEGKLYIQARPLEAVA